MENLTSLTLWEDGITIMLMGMGVVFTFLTIMVFVMNLNAVIIKKLNEIFPEEVPQQAKPTRKALKDEDDKIALAIAIATAKANGHI